MQKTILILLLVVFIFSCRKRSMEVAGVVYDYYTGQPAENVKVNMHKSIPFPGFPDGDKVLKSTFSDINGYFFFEIKENPEKVRVVANSFGYEGIPNADTTNKISRLVKGYNNVKLFVGQEGKFILKLLNVSPYDNNDLIQLFCDNVSTADGSEMPGDIILPNIQTTG